MAFDSMECVLVTDINKFDSSAGVEELQKRSFKSI
jgi:hypothetical protein